LSPILQTTGVPVLSPRLLALLAALLAAAGYLMLRAL
jgi:hypothetical protein